MFVVELNGHRKWKGNTLEEALKQFHKERLVCQKLPFVGVLRVMQTFPTGYQHVFISLHCKSDIPALFSPCVPLPWLDVGDFVE